MKKILIIGPAWVGDMVMAQSLFKALKTQANDTEIDVLAPEWSRPILDCMPEVRKAHAMPIGHGTLKLSLRYQLASSLKSEHYDQAIVLPNSWKSALIPCWAKIPKRTGWRGEMRWGLLNDLRILNKKTFPKMIERFVALAFPADHFKPGQPYPKPALFPNPEQVNMTLSKFSLSDGAPILMLCPGAEFGPSKRWPEKYYAEIARHYLKLGYKVGLLGSKNDLPISEMINHLTQNHCVNLSGNTSLSEAIDLLSASTKVLSNDSGLMHIAAALDRPLLALYGSTDPNFTPPLSTKAEIKNLALPCSPCFKRSCPLTHHRCMQDLLPQTILESLEGLERRETV